ncbi:C-type lectin mannose-binding isoform-like [Patiria miniata]|uniref:C-type lectin domain-containing protein n=1 Tax=Patiria miniata TaxID=46514 RepID=A0A914A284_PATMI|nr:C-type lectin mannose-binding isoform-like [Patiria miniata]XP_038057471.1 C-type lectin mannose-binding isoform-like [Patiria miniata]XP_038057528.1 C-type lectin mannose-binding isoform-like [Patiria miniata]
MAFMSEFFAIVVAVLSMRALSESNFCPSRSPVKSSCPPEWQLWGSACYRLTSSTYNWDDAKTACQDVGGKMAAPRSLEELNFMAELARKVDSQYRAWIACNDKEVEGAWECDGQEGGEPFLVWADGQPNSWGGNQDCAKLAARFNDTMDDARCESPWRAFCVRHAACTHLPTQPRRYCLSTDTHGRILNSTCLLDHNIREFITEGLVACGSACANESGCRSFNIKKTKEGKKVCQLNNSTSSEVKDKFQKTDYFCMYSEVCVG